MAANAFSAIPFARQAQLIGRLLIGLVALQLLTGCASLDPRPDLARLYAGASNNQSQPPVIVIHGLMGSTLVDRQSGEEVWPGSIGALALSNYRSLARMEADEREGRGLIPGDLFFGVGGVDFYSGLLGTLENIGRYHRGKPGESIGTGDRRHYYVLLYDWRRDNVEAVRALHQLIDQIRIDYADPTLRVDIIAHSNGGLITNYYLRYGPNDVLDWEHPAQWNEASTRIRRVVLLGTPNLGSVASVKRLFQGYRIALRTVPVEVMSTFSTPFETLPHPLVKSIVDANGQELDIDIYDPASWRSRHWSVYSPEVMDRVRKSVDSVELGDAAVKQLQKTFERNLRRARRFQWALTPSFEDAQIDIAVFGGDCELTQARAMLESDAAGERLIFDRQLLKQTDISRDYDQLMLEPGDGLVTRASQVGRATQSTGREREPFNFFPIAQTFFLCERHGQLTVNPYFQNNLLYFLFAS